MLQGSAILLLSLGYLGLLFAIAHLGDRLGPWVPMTAGPLIGAVGVALLTRIGADPHYLTDVLLPVTLLAAGLTLTVTPLTATVLAAVEEDRVGLASGVNNAVARAGGLLIIAVLPVLTGLGPDGFGEPAELEPAFRIAMLVCALLLALGAVIAVATLGPWTSLGPAREHPESRRHCAVDAPPAG